CWSAFRRVAESPLFPSATLFRTSRTRHVRSCVSQLHDGQAHDSQAPRGLGAARRRASTKGISRRASFLRRPAIAARARADAEELARRAVLTLASGSIADSRQLNG